MYLSRLDLVGFKSFAHKIDLSFNDGVTAIVGPNGCGKTNIVDAIRWVLGEQKTSMLRADSMEQVIFNGSKARKPLGMAEVSLTIENNKKILPTEYAQVVITRRLFRSGESQYLLNKTQCRLRDIVDLFMDTGMGANAYSVIELKMIETILSDKADERRHLFEEAAGVTKYKARRKEASRKLEAAQRDIARVQDIVREVEKTVNSLARQAAKARSHQEVSAELKQIEQLLFAFEYAEEFVVLQQLKEQVQQVRQQREAAELAVNTAEGAVGLAEESHNTAERTLREYQDEETNVRSRLSDAKQEASVLEERLTSFTQTIERLEREHSEQSEQQLTTSERLEAVRAKIQTVRLKVEELQHQKSAKQEIANSTLANLENQRVSLRSIQDSLSAEKQTLNDYKNLVERSQVQQQALQRRIEENLEHTQRLELRKNEVAEIIAKESSLLPELDAELQGAEQRLHIGEETLQSLRTEQDDIQHRLDSTRTKMAHGSASLEFLSGLVDTTESSKFLLNTAEWKPSGEKLTLAEVLNTTDELRVAIEAALGDAARYFVVANRAEANDAISALSRNNVGKATFLCLDAVPSISAPNELPKHANALGWASELVQVSDELKGAVRGILGRIIVVENLEAAWSAISSSDAVSAVTLAGEVVHRAGAVRGGSTSRTEGVRVGRKERIEQLKVEIEELQKSIVNDERRIDEIRQQTSTIDVRELSQVVRQAAVKRNDQQQKVETLQGRLDDIEGQINQLSAASESFAAEITELIARLQEVSENIVSQQQKVATISASVDDAMVLESEAEIQYNSALGGLREAEIELVRFTADLDALLADEQRLTNETISIDERKGLRAAEKVSAEEQTIQLRELLSEARLAVEREQKNLADAVAKCEAQELVVSEAATATHSSIEEVRTARKSLEFYVQQVHELDLKHNNSTLRIESLVQKATEDLEIEIPENPQKPESDKSTAELKDASQELRRKLTMMGNVNFLALEEHEREQERLTFLSSQLNDLIESERTLNETIAEINRTAREQFVNSFEAIRTNFTDLFKVLFSEDDEADLEMIESEDHDPLECKIEIIAKPRGKRPHSIEMLSGGEKTLTAIALLFAIYLVKPSPFCILDEVDAPLDDANIDRYLKLIRKFSENTQFLMITHNKKTMEAADTLYGVTMEETAVSKVVSVQLTADKQNKSAA